MLRAGDLVKRQLRNGYEDYLIVLGVASPPYDKHRGRTYYSVLYKGGKRGKMYLPDDWLIQRLPRENHDITTHAKKIIVRYNINTTNQKEIYMVKTKHTEKCTGIVQLVPDNQDYLITLQSKIIDMFPEQILLPKLHITILHQSFPKMIGSGKTRGDKKLKAAYKEGKQNNVPTPTVSYGDVYMATGEGDETGRVSTYVVIPETQLCKDARDAILSEAGVIDILGHVVGTPEQNRVFHVSLTNLTGNGGDSIKYPNLAKDQKLEVPA